jgi:alkaline phosphatase D
MHCYYTYIYINYLTSHVTGDFIYEYGNVATPKPADWFDYSQSREPKGASMVPATEIVTLQDYRQRYALYMTDKDLLRLRQALPWIVM